MKSRILVISVFIVLLLAIQGTEAISAEKNVPKLSAPPIVYDVLEKCMMVIREKDTLAENAKDLNEQKEGELRNWFIRVNFQSLQTYSMERNDLESCRFAALECLNASPNSHTRTSKKADLTIKMMSVIADFEIDGKSVRENGYMGLEKPIDAINELSKILLVAKSEVDSKKLENARPAVKYFVEYLIIYGEMFYAVSKANKGETGINRPVVAQSALISMKPTNLKNQIEQREFMNLHKSLVLASRSTTEYFEKRNPYDVVVVTLPVVDFISIVKKLNITEREMVEIGVKEFSEIVRSINEVPETYK